jgi:uncharacterized protein DUF3667
VADGICNNCGASLLGAYCHRCGQKEADTDWRSLGAIARQFRRELVSFDYKSARSVVALLAPGRLAAEFIAGRRVRYLSPLKLYFLAAAIFFVVAPRATDFGFERQMALDRSGEFRALVERRIATTHMSRELFAERFDRKLQTIYTLMPILSVLSMTLILRMLYGRRFPWLGPHMVLALYNVAFGYLAALVLHGLNHWLHAPHPAILLAVQFGILAPYMFVGLQRVYGEPAGRTLWKCALVMVLTFAIDSPINVGATLLSVAIT